MESKKLFKQLNSLFWFVMYCLPLLFLIVTVVGNFAIYRETGVTVDVSILTLSMTDINNVFSGFNWSFISDVLTDLFVSLQFTTDTLVSSFIVMFFTWFIQLTFIHLLIDFVLWLPRFFHNIMERWS